MRRRRAKAREGWEDRCEADNFTFHTHQPEGTAYWKEGAYYEFTAEAIGQIEQGSFFFFFFFLLYRGILKVK